MSAEQLIQSMREEQETLAAIDQADEEACPAEPERAWRHETLAEALVAAQAEMPAVEKDSTNPHFRSRFTSLDHLIAKTRPVLNRHGLAISQWPTFVADEGVIMQALRTTLTHVSGESDSSVMLLVLAKNDMQGLGAALTYAKRYAWSAACAISTDEDDDGESIASHNETAPRATPAQARMTVPAPTTPATGTASARKVTDRQLSAIHALASKLQGAGVFSEEQFRAVLKVDYQVDSSKDLSNAKASELIERLKAREKQLAGGDTP